MPKTPKLKESNQLTQLMIIQYPKLHGNCLLKDSFEKLSDKFKEMKSLAIDYKDIKETEISKLSDEVEKFKKMVEESQSIYETMLDKTAESLEEIIKKTETGSKVQ